MSRSPTEIAREGLEAWRSGGREGAVIVVAHPSEIGGSDWPEETATAMTFPEGRVVSMQDHPAESEALDAVAQT